MEAKKKQRSLGRGGLVALERKERRVKLRRRKKDEWLKRRREKMEVKQERP